MAFCTVNQFLATVDNRVVKEHLSDSGSPLNQSDLEDNDILNQLLNEATEMIRSAVQVRNKYTFEELDTMAAGEVDGVAYQYGFYLRRLTAALAYGLLMMRRGRPASDIAKLAPQFSMALADLERLRAGELIFPSYEAGTHETAGLPSVSDDLDYDNTPTGFRPLSKRTNTRLFPSDSDAPF